MNAVMNATPAYHPMLPLAGLLFVASFGPGPASVDKSC